MRSISRTVFAFAALRADGAVIPWGNPLAGGEDGIARFWFVGHRRTCSTCVLRDGEEAFRFDRQNLFGLRCDHIRPIRHAGAVSTFDRLRPPKK